MLIEGRVLINFLTAGYPTKDATVPLMMALEAGGTDIIELGVPFSDPIADGPVIQVANTVSEGKCDLPGLKLTAQTAIENNVHYEDCLRYVREARAQGLKAPVVFMGEFAFGGPSAEVESASGIRDVGPERKGPSPGAILGVADSEYRTLDGCLLINIGYYNPLIAYGEEKAVRDAKEAGANGYIMVDLPPAEALKFRQICTSEG